MKTLISFIVILLFVSTNAQWTQVTSPTQNNLNCVRVVDSLIAYIGGNGGKVFKTTNGGVSWLDRSPQSNIDWYCMSFVDENHGWVGGRHGTVARTVNGGSSWEINSVYSSAFTNVIESMYFSDNNIGYITGGIYSDNDRQTYIYKTTNGGQSWIQQSLLFGGVFLEMSFVDQYIGYCVGTNGGVYKTLNGGITWNPFFVNTGYWLRSVFFFNERDGVALGQSGSAWKTTNGGIAWTGVYTPVPNWIESVWFIDEGFGWAVGGGGLCIFTLDGGNSWGNSTLPTNSYLWSIHFNDSTGMIVGNNGTIFRTKNAGTPVELISFTASVKTNSVFLTWFTASELNNQGFEIERKQLYNGSSKLETEKWILIGFVNGKGTTTEQQSYSFSDNFLSEGKFQYRLKQIDYNGNYSYSNIIEVEVKLPHKFLLEQNFPNPFNPVSNIRFSLPISNHVVLKVYDSIGQEIFEIVNEFLDAGVHEYEFDAKNLPSGVYFYKLISGDYVNTKKMNLLK